MAKFSVWRDEDEDEEEEVNKEEIFPKRRRTCHHQNLPSTSESNDHNHETDSTGRTNTNNSGGPISLILSDPDVLDCCICFEPLTIPVFQCDNGHIACFTCCNNLRNKCPSCCGQIGNNRCRAIEKVIESVKVSCCYSKNGCEESVNYCKKHEHEEKCSFAPLLCPFTKCLFRGSPRKLSHHMCREHSGLVVRFHYNSVFSVSMGKDENFLVLQEEKDGVLFILTHGNTVALTCIDSSLSKEGFKYDIVLLRGCSSLKFRSSTHCTTGHLTMPPSVDYVMIPGYFYHTGPIHLKLEISVWSRDCSSRIDDT